MTTQSVPTKPPMDVSRITPAPGSIRALLQATTVKDQFERVLGDKTKAGMFIASLATVVYANRALNECDPQTIIAAALQAAALDLPINPNLGFAYIVPYKSKAQFQPGYRGIIQLALRTGQYKRIEVNHAHQGEITVVNRFTGEIRFNEPKGDEFAGVMAYMRLTSGFEKFSYWTMDRIHTHAKRYSKGYDRKDGAWQTNPESMELKTVLSDLVRKWGIMSVELVQAFQADEAEPEPEPTNGHGDRTTTNTALFGDDTEPTPTTPADNAALDQEILAREAAARG